MGPNDTTMAGLQCWVSAAERPREAVGINTPLGPEWQAAFADEADASARLARTPEEGEWPKRDAVPFVETIREGRYTITGTVEGEATARDRVPVVRDAAYWRSVTNGVFAFDPALGPDHMPARGFTEQTIGLRPAEVTEEMIKAGVTEMQYFEPGDDWGGWLSDAYRAMHAAAPVPLVSDAEIALTRERDGAISRMEDSDALYEDALARLKDVTRERDEAFAMRNETMAALATMKAERNAAVLRANEWEDEALRRWHEILTLRATAQSVAEPATPDPIANAIRPRETERWRIGG